MAVHVMATMGREGDIKKTWDPERPVEVADAKRTFDELVGKQYLAYDVDPVSGNARNMLTEFNPALGKIILVPRFAGG